MFNTRLVSCEACQVQLRRKITIKRRNKPPPEEGATPSRLTLLVPANLLGLCY